MKQDNIVHVEKHVVVQTKKQNEIENDAVVVERKSTFKKLLDKLKRKKSNIKTVNDASSTYLFYQMLLIKISQFKTRQNNFLNVFILGEDNINIKNGLKNQTTSRACVIF